MNSTDIILHKYVDELQCDEKKWRADCCCYSCTRCCKVEPEFTTECGESLKSQQKAFVGVKLWLSLLSWNTITIAEKSSGQHFTNQEYAKSSTFSERQKPPMAKKRKTCLRRIYGMYASCTDLRL